MDWDAFYDSLYPSNTDEEGVDWDAAGANAASLLDQVLGAFGYTDDTSSTTTTTSALDAWVPYAVVGGFLLAIVALVTRK